ncbi:hypothetical protein SNOG_04324 [Parastagonospora nodorum SN15]|uniref:Uncharacterized protein n=1 Tax=Phaeosphaeria nodorum (strain SN15 / ATCC MYA-4574 / FGSC 10173) TaxID=321614 RepID=Q0UV90_PHANO|nr:hypothetical protein SNOG_04324 [Parastagonospora nodorum SN15]EAT88084.1 hypothetical protein SNOG_04324 [Parastagonospora nodorum SN15]
MATQFDAFLSPVSPYMSPPTSAFDALQVFTAWCAPYTLSQAQDYMSQGPLGQRINWIQDNPNGLPHFIGRRHQDPYGNSPGSFPHPCSFWTRSACSSIQARVQSLLSGLWQRETPLYDPTS